MQAHALVVGGSSDIGRAVGAVLGELGLGVTLWGRDPDRLRAAAGPATSTRRVDLEDPDDLERAAADLPTGPLEVVVWAAGLFDWGATQEADPRTWRRVVDVNLGAAAATTALLAPRLVGAAPSALVYVGSGAARTAFPDNASYVASKHGLRGLAEGVWLDLRRAGVKVSTVSPGLVAAGAGLQAPGAAAHPERLLQPADVAAAVRFVVTFSSHACPTEIRLEPQDPP